jgi:WD40 repeat protein
MVRVFLSHSSRDGAEVDDLAAFLHDAEGHTVFLDRHPGTGIRAGQLWEQVLYDNLHGSDVVVCWVTEHHVASRWCFAEVALAKALGRLVLPVRAQTGVDHPLLDAVQGIDYADPGAAHARLGERLREVEVGGGLAWDPDRPLYPGLVPFEREDAPVFFGRDREIAELATQIRGLRARREHNAVVVVGASGSGKSSMVRAGLLPRLVTGGWWVAPPLLPGADPLAALTFSLACAWKDLDPGGVPELRVLGQRVEEDVEGVIRELLLRAPGRRQALVVIVDQLEELFTRAEPGRAAEFLTLLDRITEPGRAVSVVATMRSEFVTELLSAEAAGRLRLSQFPLTPLDRGRLAGIVTGPARKGRLQFSDEVVHRLVEDTGSGTALPLLAVTLERLTRRAGPGARIDVDRYEEVGGVGGAIRVQADSALAAATRRTGLPAARVLDALLALVALDASGTPTRRRVPRADMPEELLPALDVFVDERLLTSDDVTGRPQLAVSHEALFTAWPELSEAIEAHAQELSLRRRLESAVADWEAAGRDRSMLWRGEQLQRAASVVAGAGGTASERAFVEESRADDAARRRREADILADRVRAADLPARDSELALLYLLAGADEQAVTPTVVGGLRSTLARHTLVGRLPAPEKPVTATAVSADGRLAAVADLGDNLAGRPTTRPRPVQPPSECRVQVWDTETGTVVRSLVVTGRAVTALRLDGGGPGAVVTVTVDDRDVAFDVATGAALPNHAAVEQGPVASAPVTRRLLQDRHGMALHAPAPVDDPTPIARVDGTVIGLRWTAHARLVVTGDGRVVDLDAREAGPPLGEVLAVSADGARLVLDDPLRVHDRVRGTSVVLSVPGVRSAGFSGDGRSIALARRTGLSVVTADDGELVSVLGRHGDEEGDVYTTVGLNDDGTRVLSTSIEGARSAVWDLATGEVVDRIQHTLFEDSPDGAPVVARDFRWAAVELPTAMEFRISERLGVDDPDAQVVLVVDPRRTALVACRPNAPVSEYGLPDGHPLFVGTERATAAAFSPDGAQVLWTRTDGTVVVSPSRDAEDVLRRARAHALRPLSPEDRASFDL